MSTDEPMEPLRVRLQCPDCDTPVLPEKAEIDAPDTVFIDARCPNCGTGLSFTMIFDQRTMQ